MDGLQWKMPFKLIITGGPLFQETTICNDQETHDGTLTTHVAELQWWKSEVEKKAQIISQQVEAWPGHMCVDPTSCVCIQLLNCYCVIK